MSVREQEDESNQSIQVAVIIPRGFVAKKYVPVAYDEDKTRGLELKTKRYSQCSCKEERKCHENFFLVKGFWRSLSAGFKR